jgi:phospholipid/cholesterol/gamma-HCH transport system substrate-binding protein
MKKSAVETIVGIIVLFIAFGFVFFSYKNGTFFSFDSEAYIVKAEFEKIDGISIGSPVKVSGISIGSVSKTTLNPSNFRALVEMKINSGILLPVDTSAEIIGMGFIGDKYVSLSPGFETQYLVNGGLIDFTQSSVSLESLIGKFMFGGVNHEQPQNKEEKDDMEIEGEQKDLHNG